ncbi:MAG TPA: hypothetical protein VM282_05300 [Acidimicrobiales bacterium]|nr:hypothetical protein [Acidimicrobiales bacterium]
MPVISLLGVWNWRGSNRDGDETDINDTPEVEAVGSGRTPADGHAGSGPAPEPEPGIDPAAGETQASAASSPTRPRDRQAQQQDADLQRALVGGFDRHRAHLARAHLRHIDERTAMINDLDARINTEIEPYATARDHLMTIRSV